MIIDLHFSNKFIKNRCKSIKIHEKLTYAIKNLDFGLSESSYEVWLPRDENFVLRLLLFKVKDGFSDSQSNESWFVGRKTLKCSLELPVRSLSVSFPSMNRGYFALRLNIKIYIFCTTFQLHCFHEMLHVAFVCD